MEFTCININILTGEIHLHNYFKLIYLKFTCININILTGVIHLHNYFKLIYLTGENHLLKK